MILFKAADLLWATRIKETADSLGLPCRPARTIDMLEARLEDSQVVGMLIDLDAGDEAFDLLARLRQPAPASPQRVEIPTPATPPATQLATPDCQTIRIIAFGPHVHKDLFQRARDAGADEVMTNGSLAANLPDTLLALSSRA